MRFFCGLHHVSDAHRFPRAFISVNRLKDRRGDFAANDWVLDSGAFTQVTQHGKFLMGVEEYAHQVWRWRACGNLLRAVSQDYMCEPFVLEITGLSVEEHQRLTIERYDRLRALCGDIVMPVLQGYAPEEYARHVAMYGDRLKFGMWVGVGSVCKRNGTPSAGLQVLRAVRKERPDLNLHGFGLKKTALQEAGIRDILYSADSMAWSYAARMAGRNGNDWREAMRFFNEIEGLPLQETLIA